jgi:hypothetical protein
VVGSVIVPVLVIAEIIGEVNVNPAKVVVVDPKDRLVEPNVNVVFAIFLAFVISYPSLCTQKQYL